MYAEQENIKFGLCYENMMSKYICFYGFVLLGNVLALSGANKIAQFIQGYFDLFYDLI